MVGTRMRALALFLGCFGFFALFAHGYLENTDATVTMQGARAWWLRGNPGLYTAEQAAALAPGTPTWQLEHLVASQIADPVQPRLGRTGVDDLRFVWFPIGHQALFVPCVALGEALAAAWPGPEERSVALRGPVVGPQFWPQFLASFLSPLAAAASVLVLLALARTLGAPRGAALTIAALATLGTQFWPGTVETLSDPVGALGLYASALAITRYALAGAGPRALLWGGAVAGLAVLVRYPLAVTLLPWLVWSALAAWRRKRLVDVAWLVAGGLPAVALMLAANTWRFADPFETGYSASAGFGGFPVWIGLFAILFAPGKGVVWFTPMLVAILVLGCSRAARAAPTLVASLGFAATVLLHSSVVYWAAGQCWGIRYVTAPLVLLVVTVLTRAWPLGTWTRRTVLGLAALGLAWSVGGVLTPYPGQQHLAHVAARTVYGEQPNLDNNVNFDLRLSPLHSHWTYAWLSARGALDSTASADTTEPLFGVVVPEPVPVVPFTDREFRHVWWRWLGEVFPGFPSGLVLLGWVIGTAGLLWFGLGRARDQSPPLA